MIPRILIRSFQFIRISDLGDESSFRPSFVPVNFSEAREAEHVCVAVYWYCSNEDDDGSCTPDGRFYCPPEKVICDTTSFHYTCLEKNSWREQPITTLQSQRMTRSDDSVDSHPKTCQFATVIGVAPFRSSSFFPKRRKLEIEYDCFAITTSQQHHTHKDFLQSSLVFSE